MISYKLVRSWRKTICITVKSANKTEVCAPMRMPQKQIDAFVERHGDWIQKQIARFAVTEKLQNEFDGSDGQETFLLGQALTIQTKRELKSALADGETLLLPESVSNRKQALIQFYREETAAYIRERIAVFAPMMGVQPTGVKVTSAKTRWGSCSGRNSLCFSYRMIALPPDLIDYVVVHELAHIREHNHSSRFYEVVAEVLPDYRQRKQRLRGWADALPF